MKREQPVSVVVSSDLEEGPASSPGKKSGGAEIARPRKGGGNPKARAKAASNKPGALGRAARKAAAEENSATAPARRRKSQAKEAPKGKRARVAKPGAKAGPAGKRKPAAAPTPPVDIVYAPARPAHARGRHWVVALAFVVCVLIPTILAASYLWTRAVDRYSSGVGFTVRQEDAPSAVEVLGGLSGLSNAAGSDSDILFEFIQSQELVEKVDARVDLRSLYTPYYEVDPLFSLAPGSSIEELISYWLRMVQISYSPGSGLIEIEVIAFTPEDAKNIAEAILDESTQMINRLSAIAREDAVGYARGELDAAVEQLKQARLTLTEFRSRTQIVDPSADIQVQMGVLTTFQQQLGAELINYDLLAETAAPNDPRLKQSEMRIAAIRERIKEERAKFGGDSAAANGQDFATLVAEFERLSVDREFAERKYLGALSNYDKAQADAQRQSRYLAAYLHPTLAQEAEYPRRELTLALVVLFSLLAWGIFVLIFYSVRDRR